MDWLPLSHTSFALMCSNWSFVRGDEKIIKVNKLIFLKTTDKRRWAQMGNYVNSNGQRIEKRYASCNSVDG